MSLFPPIGWRVWRRLNPPPSRLGGSWTCQELGKSIPSAGTPLNSLVHSLIVLPSSGPVVSEFNVFEMFSPFL